MRPRSAPESAVELAGLVANLAPTPVVDSFYAMMLARTVMAGQRLGLFAALCDGPQQASALAQRLDLSPEGTEHLCACLEQAGIVGAQDGAYSLRRRARRWLDPASDRYVGTYIEFNYDQWGWWSELEDVVRRGASAAIHDLEGDAAYWERYIRGQFELARLSGPVVARLLRLPADPRSLLDLAGGHGWFAAALCRRHPGLSATVIDLPDSAAVGRRIIAEAGMADRVRHVDGDLADADLGGPHDGALVFNIAHHLSPEDNVALLRRVRAALRPGGTVAVLELLSDDARGRNAWLGMHFFITSGARTYSEADVRGWLGEAGFGRVRKLPVVTLPQTLLQARAV